MKRSTLVSWIGIAALALVAAAGTMSSARAYDEFVVTGQAGVRVWVDGGDIYDDYDDVLVYLRADRDCYATLMLVDTDGYLHVLYPSSPYERAWLRGGRTYRYHAYELGLDRLDGVGIAHLYAVGSPAPFDYSYYGASVFIGGFGFRIYGDPYIACRDFYVSLLPVSCRWDYVGVSSARFYVRRWVRYPSYLCSPGISVHVRIGDNCRQCSHVYASYRGSVASPYEGLRPERRKFKDVYASDRAVAPFGRVEHARSRGVAAEPRRDRVPAKALVRGDGKSVPKVPDRAVEPRAKRVERAKVVSSSRSGNAARATVKSSDRKGEVAAPAARNSGDTRVVRKSAVTPKNATVATQRTTVTPRKATVTTRKATVETKKAAVSTKRTAAKGKSDAGSQKKGAGKRVRQAR